MSKKKKGTYRKNTDVKYDKTDKPSKRKPVTVGKDS